MRTLRRALLALGLAGFAAGALRLRTGCVVPAQTGGWKEIPEAELE